MPQSVRPSRSSRRFAKLALPALSAWGVLGAALVLLVAGCASSERSLQLVSGSAVVYPAAARAAGIEGYVVVRYDVDADGRTVNARVVEAEPADVFDAAALATVASWRFRPARGAQPRRVEGVQSRVQFTLGGGEAYRDL